MCDFDRVFSCPDFGVCCIEKFKDGMQRGGFARTGGTANVKQAVEFGDCFFKPLFVVHGQSEFVERYRLARRQNPHRHVLNSARREDSGNAQLNVYGAVFFKVDLAILRFALFRNIEVAHDLQACHHGLSKLCRHFNVELWCAVCSGQVISDSLIGFFDVDSRSKALGDKLPSFECSLMLL